MADGFVAKFECAICQGVNDYSEYCVLNCGHPFHVVCVEQWLAHSPSATCPSCRAKVNKRSTRLILGIESAPEAQGDEAIQQRLHSQQQQVVELQKAVVDKQQQVDQFQLLINKLEDKQDLLQGKLADAKARLSTVETAHAAGLQRVNVLTAEKQKQLERHKTELQRLQRQLHDEEGKSRQVQAAMRRLQLTNPHLTNLAAVQQLAGLDQDGSAAATPADLAATLVQRNTELQQAKHQAQQLQQQQQQLQQQLQVQQEEAEQQLQVAAGQHAAELRVLQEEKEQHMREAIALEYEKDKILRRLEQQEQKVQQQQQALTTQQQEIEQLKGVLLVLQGGSVPASVLKDSTRLNRQQQGYIKQQKGNELLAALWPTQPATLFRAKHMQKQPNPGSKSNGQSCAATGACDHSTSSGDYPADPSDSQDALLAELLGDATPSSHATVDQHGASVDGDVCEAMNLGSGSRKEQQQRSSLQQSNTVQAPRGQSAGLAGNATSPPGPTTRTVGSTVLQASTVMVGVPSFIAKAKSATGAKSAFIPQSAGGSSTVSGQYIRQGPDGKGGVVTHLALNKKRASRLTRRFLGYVAQAAPYAGTSATKKHNSFVHATGSRAEAAKGIAAYFNSR